MYLCGALCTHTRTHARTHAHTHTPQGAHQSRPHFHFIPQWRERPNWNADIEQSVDEELSRIITGADLHCTYVGSNMAT